jgi:hypothetical protein
MKCTISSLGIQCLLSAGLATILAMLPLHAEPRCPGNVSSVTPRFVRGTLIVVPVKVNQAGPFDFIVDTGAQVSLVDPLLASQLALKSQGTVGLVSAASHAHASVAVLDTLDADSHLVQRPLVIVQDLAPFQAIDAHIRGVLGENFLAHFDFLIDYRHKLLCLDDTRVMRDQMHGEHIALAMPPHPENDLPFTERLVIPVHLSATGTRQLLVQLDSGSDAPVLYAARENKNLPLLESITLRERTMSKAPESFASLQPQYMQIGTRILGPISFLTPTNVAKDMPPQNEDGLLPTAIFQRVFICHADHYVIFDPR